MNNLMTTEIEKELNRVGLYADEGEEYNENLCADDLQVIAHYYIPETVYHWFILGGEKENEEWILFGFAHIFCGELGLIYLSDLERLKLKVYGITRCVVRDITKMDTLGNMKKRYNIN